MPRAQTTSKKSSETKKSNTKTSSTTSSKTKSTTAKTSASGKTKAAAKTSKTTIAAKSSSRRKTTEVTAAAAVTTISPQIRQEMIAEAAYYIAQSRGFSEGNPESDWFRAERQIDEMIQQ